MGNRTISDLISAYLEEYANAPSGKRAEPSPETVAALRRDPRQAFQVIDRGRFQKPEGLDPRDIDAPIFLLLTAFVELIPELLIPRMTHGFWATRYPYIQSAACSRSAAFVPAIIGLLADRSIYIQALVLNLIVRCPHLQVPEAMPGLEKLVKMKSFQEPGPDRELLEQAMRAVAPPA